jgi:hypothetical protein
MARPQAINGGKVVTFARHASDAAADLRVLRRDVENTQALARNRQLPVADRRRQALDVRIELLQRSALSHEQAISGNRTPLCGSYECQDPSCTELLCLAEIRRRTAESVPA